MTGLASRIAIQVLAVVGASCSSRATVRVATRRTFPLVCVEGLVSRWQNPFRIAGAAVLSLVAAGCGSGNPVAPSPPAGQVLPTPAGPLRSVAGNWGGTVNQSGFLYPVELTIDGAAALGARAATVHYPTLACSGFWIFDDVTGSEYRMTERITQGGVNSGGGCLDPVGVVFDLSSSPRQLALRLIVNGAVGATATLTPR